MRNTTPGVRGDHPVIHPMKRSKKRNKVYMHVQRYDTIACVPCPTDGNVIVFLLVVLYNLTLPNVVTHLR